MRSALEDRAMRGIKIEQKLCVYRIITIRFDIREQFVVFHGPIFQCTLNLSICLIVIWYICVFLCPCKIKVVNHFKSRKNARFPKDMRRIILVKRNPSIVI